MQLMLTDEEVRTLHDLLQTYLPDLRREAAATDLPAHELRHELYKRLGLCERLVAELEQQGVGSQAAIKR